MSRRSTFVSVAAFERAERRYAGKRRTMQRRAERALVAALRAPLAGPDALELSAARSHGRRSVGSVGGAL